MDRKRDYFDSLIRKESYTRAAKYADENFSDFVKEMTIEELRGF